MNNASGSYEKPSQPAPNNHKGIVDIGKGFQGLGNLRPQPSPQPSGGSSGSSNGQSGTKK